MPYFNAKSEIHHPYAAKRLFLFGRHGARGLGKRSKKGLGSKFGPNFAQDLVVCLLHCYGVLNC